MNRRTLVLGGGITLATTLSGCLSDSETDDDESTNCREELDDVDVDGEHTGTGFGSIRHVPDQYDADSTTFSGEGASSTDEVDIGATLHTILFEHYGCSTFSVELVRDTGEIEQAIVDVGGPVEGATAVDLTGGFYSFDIDADGEWELTVANPSPDDDDITTPSAEAMGYGDDVVGPINLDGETVVAAEHDGEGDFLVEVHHESGDLRELLFDEMGAFDDKTETEFNATSWFRIEADGNWSLAVE